MEDSASINIFSNFHHRLTHNFAQGPFFDECQREKCVLQGVTFIGEKAWKMKKVTAHALLSFVVWSE
jgi:hypothetical protein